MTCYLPWGRIPGCITQETQQMSTQRIVQECLILQSLMIIAENDSAGVCTHQRLGGITLKKQRMTVL